MSEYNLRDLDDRLREVEANQRAIIRGEDDCQKIMNIRITMLEEWKDKASLGMIAVLVTSSIAMLSALVGAILTWALNK